MDILVCMYCLRRYGESEPGQGVSHGVCPACGSLALDVRDEIARVHQAVRRAGGRMPAGCVVAAAPFVLLSSECLALILRLKVDIGSLPLVAAAVRFSATSPIYAGELALRTDPRLVPLLAAVAGSAA